MNDENSLDGEEELKRTMRARRDEDRARELST
jgi:hypothetical protein